MIQHLTINNQENSEIDFLSNEMPDELQLTLMPVDYTANYTDQKTEISTQLFAFSDDDEDYDDDDEDYDDDDEDYDDDDEDYDDDDEDYDDDDEDEEDYDYDDMEYDDSDD